MNFLAGGLIVLACTYIGIGIDNYYKLRIKILKEFLTFIDFSMVEINCMKTNILSLFEKFNNNYPSKLSEVLLKIDNPLDINEEKINLNVITKNEKMMIISFIQDITKLDTDGQKVFFASHKDKLNRYIIKSETENNTKGNLARKLAPLLGIGIMIIVL